MLGIPVGIPPGQGEIGRKFVKGAIPGDEVLGNGGHQILLVLRRHGLLQDETVMDLLRDFGHAGVVAGDQRRQDILARLLDRQHLLAQQVAQLGRNSWL